MSGSKDGQTLFHRIIPVTAMSLTSKTAKNWHLKVKDIQYVDLTKNYCIRVSIEKISLIHNSFNIHPKIIEITFSFPGFAPACKKISSFHQLILETQSVLESCDPAAHTNAQPMPNPF